MHSTEVNRQTPGAGGSYDASFDDKRQVWAEQLSGLVDYLGSQGMSETDLVPLSDLQRALVDQEFDEEDDGPDEFMEARTGNAPPSDAILARAAAVIDLLVLEGKTEEAAAQFITRKLMLAGVNPPDVGGDARGFMRLAEWRQKLRKGLFEADVVAEYERFRDTVAEIPTRERVNRVLTERLWDRRGSAR